MGVIYRAVGFHQDRTIGRSADNGNGAEIKPIVGIGIVAGQIQRRGRSFIHGEAVSHRHRCIIDARYRDGNGCSVGGAVGIGEIVTKAVGRGGSCYQVVELTVRVIGKSAVRLDRDQTLCRCGIDRGYRDMRIAILAVVGQHACGCRGGFYRTELHEFTTKQVFGCLVLGGDPVRAAVDMRYLHLVDITVEIVKRVVVTERESAGIAGHGAAGIAAGRYFDAIQVKPRGTRSITVVGIAQGRLLPFADGQYVVCGIDDFQAVQVEGQVIGAITTTEIVGGIVSP